MASTPKTFKRTKRILFQRRMAYMDRPLLIVCFQGVLGDFHKGCTKPEKKPKPEKGKSEPDSWNNLNLRQDAVAGLRYLSGCFQLVVFSREAIEDSWAAESDEKFGSQTKTIKQFLLMHPDIPIDGFYCSTLPPRKTTLCDDYSQVFIDFGLNSEKKIRERVLFISAIANDNVPGLVPSQQKLFDIDPLGYFMFDMSCQPPQPLCSGIPIAVEQNPSRRQKAKKDSEMNHTDSEVCKEEIVQLHEMPVTVLVPNARAQVPRTQLAFSQIVKSVMVLAILAQKKT